VPTVLVVEDDAALRQMLEGVLVQEGFPVLLTASAAGLSELVRKEQPDVVLLDQIMAPICGVDALRALRSSGERVPVVMLTRVPPEDLLETAVDVGADDYISKPFSYAVLVAHLKAILRRVHWQNWPVA
jgi:DNA-binding response OmpR family regulator